MKPCNDVDVVIIACKVDCGFCRENQITVSASSTPKIPVGTSCADAIEMLLENGYDLINTETLQSSGQIVHTFAKYEKVCC
ncbi:hypothetical protein [Clostridium ganghwense]|uniref:DUF1667 domain-containing protein n=1 Tax=Clostridium ganghwense TaxID=312089 RepID=A0ABT4CQW1_9CLOT|nr:hypothetical protein [Clostridium ganghwense]MCY6371449.1 hypothetical protein [Clostridium ganghwense]